MKIIIIAIMLFLVNLSIVMVDTLEIFNYNIATQENWNEEVEAIEGQEYLRSDVATDVSTSFGFGDFIVALKTFADFIFRVLDIANTFKLFGLDPTLARLISLPVFILYGIGLSQFVGNRGTKGME